MTFEPQGEPVYVCGHDADKIARLACQGAFFEPITRRMLTEAGIGSVVRVLERPSVTCATAAWSS